MTTISMRSRLEESLPRRTVQTNPVAIDPAALLSNHFLFRGLGPEVHDRLRSFAKIKTFRRGATIFSKGDPGTSLFAVCDGIARVTALSARGKNAVFNLIRQGEIFGEIALIDGKSRTADAAAFTNCTLMVIDRRDFLPLLRSHPEVAIRLLDVLCARLRKTTEQVEDLMFLDLRSRLGKTLLRLSEMQPGGEIEITQDDLSELVGVSREMINKQLQLWAKERLIRLARRRIAVLEPDALARIAAEE